MFDRFQTGADRVSGDPRLFNGVLCMHINGVQRQDMKTVKQEFENVIREIIADTPLVCGCCLMYKLVAIRVPCIRLVFKNMLRVFFVAKRVTLCYFKP